MVRSEGKKEWRERERLGGFYLIYLKRVEIYNPNTAFYQNNGTIFRNKKRAET